MDLQAYFAQDENYFSESEHQMVRITDMPFNRAFYSHLKLLDTFGDEYEGTRLCKRFAQIIAPPPDEIRFQIIKYGKACHAYSGSTTEVRSKLYNALKNKGKVTTHKHQHKPGIGWIEAVVETEVKVTVKSHRGS